MDYPHTNSQFFHEEFTELAQVGCRPTILFDFFDLDSRPDLSHLWWVPGPRSGPSKPSYWNSLHGPPINLGLDR